MTTKIQENKKHKFKKYSNGISKRRSDVFSSVIIPVVTDTPSVPKKELLQFTKPTKKKKAARQKRQETWLAIEDRIRQLHPPETACKYNKKRKRQLVQQLNLQGIEVQVFYAYCKKCRRAFKVTAPAKKKSRKKPRRLTYETYINSPLWTSRKNRYYQKHKRQCAACGSFEHIHLHHMVYGKYGQEPDEHLIPLCENHHDDYHTKNGVQRRMIERTMSYVETINSLTGFTYAATSKISPHRGDEG